MIEGKSYFWRTRGEGALSRTANLISHCLISRSRLQPSHPLWRVGQNPCHLLLPQVCQDLCCAKSRRQAAYRRILWTLSHSDSRDHGSAATECADVTSVWSA